MRKSLAALFKLPRKRRPDPLAHIPRWKVLGRKEIRLHIADATNPRARQGWDEAKRLRPDWRIVP